MATRRTPRKVYAVTAGAIELDDNPVPLTPEDLAANGFSQQPTSNKDSEGLTPLPAAPGVMRSGADLAVRGVSGALGAGKALADAAGANNVVSRGLGAAADAVQGMGSDYDQALRTRAAERMQRATDSGSLANEIQAALSNLAEAPGRNLAEGAGSLALPLGAGLATKLARFGPAGVKATIAMMGAAQGTGAVKGGIYDTTRQELISAGVDEKEATEIALAAQEYLGPNKDQIALGAGIGLASGVTGVEGAAGRMLAGGAARGAARSGAGAAARAIGKGAATEAITEGIQEGQEAVAGNLAAQRAGAPVDDIYRGAAGRATHGAVIGAALGGAASGVEHATAPAEPTLPSAADMAGQPEQPGPPGQPGQPPADPTTDPAAATVPERPTGVLERAALSAAERRAAAQQMAMANPVTPGPGLPPTASPGAAMAQATALARSEPNAPPADPRQDQQLAAAIDNFRAEMGFPDGALPPAEPITTDPPAQATAAPNAAPSPAPAPQRTRLEIDEDGVIHEVPDDSEPEAAPEAAPPASAGAALAAAARRDKPAAAPVPSTSQTDSAPAATSSRTKNAPSSALQGAKAPSPGPAVTPPSATRGADTATRTAGAPDTPSGSSTRATTPTPADLPTPGSGSDSPAAQKLHAVGVALRFWVGPGVTGDSAVKRAANGRAQLQGDPTRTAAGRKLLASMDEAIQAGATQQQVDAALLDAAQRAPTRPKQPTLADRPTFPTPDAAHAHARRMRRTSGSSIPTKIVPAPQGEGFILLTRMDPGYDAAQGIDPPPPSATIAATGAPAPANKTPANNDSQGKPSNDTTPDPRTVSPDTAERSQRPADGTEPRQTGPRPRPGQAGADANGRQEPTAAAVTPAPVSQVDRDAKAANRNPTDAQKKAGNYKLGHTRIGKLDISIENPNGSMRSGTDRNGTRWSIRMAAHYGYIRGTNARDGDKVDVFIRPGTPPDYAGPVFIVDQVHTDTRLFDEHKVMLGYPNLEAARRGYYANYSRGWQGLGAITERSMAEFEQWISDGKHNLPIDRKAVRVTPAPTPDAKPSPAPAPKATTTTPRPSLADKRRAAQKGPVERAAPPKPSTPAEIAQPATPAPKQEKPKREPVDRSAAAAARQAKARIIDRERDDMLTAIAKLGGLDREQAMAEFGGLEKADFSRSGGFGLPVFRKKGGRSVDDIRLQLVQYGYLDADEIQQFEDRLDDSLRGNRHFTPEGWMREAARQADERAEADADTPVWTDADSELAATLDDLDDAVINALLEIANDENREITAEALDAIEADARADGATEEGDGSPAARQAQGTDSGGSPESGPDGFLSPSGRSSAAAAASRGRPVDAVTFDTPIVGPSGAQLTGYRWAWKPVDDVNARGDDVMRRISDWDEAEINADTGRDIVHQFAVTLPDGSSQVLSAESTMKAMGYAADAGRQAFQPIATAAKTLARLRVALAEAETAQGALATARAEVDALPLPSMPTERDSAGWWHLGDARMRQKDGDAMTAERRRALIDAWRGNRLQERGWKDADKERIDARIADLQRRAKRAQRRLDDTASQQPDASDFLTAPTVEGLNAQAAALERDRAARARRDAAPDPAEFRLTGSNRDADQAAAAGQNALFEPNRQRYKPSDLRDNTAQNDVSRPPNADSGRKGTPGNPAADRAMGADPAARDRNGRNGAQPAATDRGPDPGLTEDDGRGFVAPTAGPYALPRDQDPYTHVVAQATRRGFKADPQGEMFGPNGQVLPAAVTKAIQRAVTRAEPAPDTRVPADSPIAPAKPLPPVVMRKVDSMRVGITEVKTAADAGHFFADLRKSARERFNMLVVDKDGKPLALTRLFIGAHNSITIPIREVALAAYQTEGAAGIWVAHNHPSGNPSASNADRNLTRILARAFGPDLGIELHGHVIVAGTQVRELRADGTDAAIDPVPIRAATRNQSLPITERLITRRNLPQGPAIQTPDLGLTAAAIHLPDSTGLVLLDAMNRPIGALPMTDEVMGQLRTEGRMRQLIRSLGEQSPSRVIVVATNPNTIQNIGSALDAMQVDMLDGIVRPNDGAPFSMAQKNIAMSNKGGTFFSRAASGSKSGGKDATPTPRPVDRVMARAKAQAARFANGPDVTVIATIDQAPDHIKAYANEGTDAGAGKVEGFFDPDTGMVYLIADALPTDADIDRVYLHETLGHLGIRAAFGPRLDGVLDDLVKRRPADIARKLREYRAANTPANRRMAAEEIIANLAERDPSATWVQRLIAAIRTGLRKLGLPVGMSDADIIARIITPARRALAGDATPSIRPDTASPLASRADQTSTKAFRDWFKGSKVVDADGNPQVVYHGSPNTFTTFDPDRIGDQGRAEGGGFYFTTSRDTAAGYGKPMAVYLAIQKPLTYDAKPFPRATMAKILRDAADREAKANDADIADGFLSNYGDIRSEGLDRVIREATDLMTNDATALDQLGGLIGSGLPAEIVNRATHAVTGHDGVVSKGFRNEGDGSETILVAFFPEQIKSATDNTGAFDPANADIRFSRGPQSDQQETALYHGGNAGLSEIQGGSGPGNLFGGIFASTDRSAAASHGDGSMYVASLPPESILRQRAIDYDLPADQVRQALADAMPWLKNDADRDIAWQAAIDDRADQVDDVDLMRVFRESDPGSAGWEAQRIRGVVANKLGFRAVEMRDEHGASYLILPGTPIRPESAAKFSRKPPANPTPPGGMTPTERQGLASGAAQWLASTLRDATTNGKKFARWRGINTQYHKATLDADFKRVFDATQAYTNDISLYANYAANLAPRLLPNLANFGDIWKKVAQKPESIDKVSSALLEGTLAGESVTDGKVWTDAELRDRGFSDHEIGLYREARKAIDRSLADLAKSEIASLGDRWLSPDAKDGIMAAGRLDDALTIALTDLDIAAEGASQAMAPEIAEIRATIEDRVNRAIDLIRAGYMPLMRFGNYGVWISKPGATPGAEPETLYFSVHDSLSKANAHGREMLEALKAEHPDASLRAGVMTQEEGKLLSGVSPDTLEVFGRGADLQDDPVWAAYIRLVKNNRSTMKRLLARKGTPGYSKDLTRILAGFITSNARAVSANLHAREMTQAVEDIPKHKGDVYDDASRLVQYMRDPREEAQALRGAMFQWFLGGSIASAVVNLSQPFTMTYPYLSVREGAVKGAARMTRAIKDAATGATLERDLQEAMALGERQGIVEPQQIHALQAEVSRNLGTNLNLRKGLYVWGYLFQAAERFNRRSAFIAAYRQARDLGDPDPYASAIKAVIETQSIYNKANRPRWARGAVGATVFTFKQFSIAYVEFLARLMRTPEGRPAAMLALGVLIVLAGVSGVPFMEDAEDLIDTLGQAAGYNLQSAQARQAFLAQVFGEQAAEVMDRGISALPGFPADIQARLGVGNLIPGTAAMLASSKSPAAEIAEVAGPVGGLFEGALGTAKGALAGDARMVANSAMPVALKNAYKAAEMWATGYYRDTRGRNVIAVDGTDTAVKGIGFQPRDVGDAQRKMREIQVTVAVVRAKESEITGRMAQAVVDRDDKALASARQALADWNAKNPDTPIRITSGQIRNRARNISATKAERLIKATPRELRGLAADRLSSS